MSGKLVGKIHLCSRYLDASLYDTGDVVRCVCNKEWVAGKDGHNAKTLTPLMSSVEYTDRSSGEPEIGNWDPSMVPTESAGDTSESTD